MLEFFDNLQSIIENGHFVVLQCQDWGNTQDIIKEKLISSRLSHFNSRFEDVVDSPVLKSKYDDFGSLLKEAIGDDYFYFELDEIGFLIPSCSLEKVLLDLHACSKGKCFFVGASSLLNVKFDENVVTTFSTSNFGK